MSILSGIFGSIQRTDMAPATSMEGSVSSSGVDFSGMKSGQTITGKIVGLNGDSVQIDLGKGNVISAKLEGAMDLQPGQTVTFSLKGNNGSQVTLSPLYMNMDHAATASKALMAANMPVNSITLTMTSQMMEAGMGIDKQSLGEMYQTVSANSEADVASLVQMKKIGLDITPKSIQQFAAYQNYENQITTGMQQIMQDIHSLFGELATGGGNQEAAQFMESVLRIFTGEQNGQNLPSSVGIEQPASGTLDGTGQSIAGNGEGLQSPQVAVQNGQTAGSASAATMGNETVISQEMLNLITPSEGEATAANMPAGSLLEGEVVPQGKENVVNGQAGMATVDNGNLLTGEMKEQLLSMLKQTGMEEQALQNIKDGNITTKDALLMVRHALGEQGLSAPIKELLLGKEFQSLLNNEISSQWMLQPEQVGKKQTVESLYDRLQQQTRDLTEVLSQIAKPESTLANNLSSMNQNLDFMNQMNQMYQYIQLPLKMSGSETTGDLFVYTDKKSLAQKDGSVSALLHLDMPNLGPLDVYASITADKSVFTKFYLESEEMIDFIEQNIHILTERLNKRGYNVKSEMVPRGENENLSQEILVKEEGVVPTTVGHFSFDMRA